MNPKAQAVLKQIKEAAEGRRHIRYYTESNELNEDVKWFTMVNPERILALIEIIELQTAALEWYATPGIHERWRAEEAREKAQKLLEGK